MKVFIGFLTRRFAILFVLLLVETSARSLLAQPKDTSGEIMVLEQKTFGPLAKHGVITFESINFESLDGKPINFDQLPAKVNEKLAGLEMQVIRRLELYGADLRDAIRVITRKETPPHMISLGLASDRQEQEVDPDWVADLSFGERRFSCVSTNVSLLVLSVVLADAFNCEFGVTADGQVVFRNKQPAVGHIRQPLYVVKPKPPKSQ